MNLGRLRDIMDFHTLGDVCNFVKRSLQPYTLRFLAGCCKADFFYTAFSKYIFVSDR